MKHCLDENSNPALRLNIAPGLNFISRRTIHAALIKLHVIEPIWSDNKSEFKKCLLCSCPLNPSLPIKINNPPNLTSTSTLNFNHNLNQPNLTALSDQYNLNSINPTTA
ncbi:hypothetical protein O181_000583 [Austropuccinia psidii MF-1]|uniref:Uncharacterized protein n=1 Tax=Austropuccinia psidii MF-1 TaxID=1389203 RepID=A0A9Q3GB01_9BASI|nr:hypothetical protein [Austropuccinia psidii MF-1]